MACHCSGYGGFVEREPHRECRWNGGPFSNQGCAGEECLIDAGLGNRHIGEPAVWVMEVPDTSGVSLKIRAPLAEVGWVMVSTVARTSGAPPPPGLPRGITKSKTASSVVPELVTVASVPGSPVVTVPMVMVAAAPVGPVGAMLKGKWL